MMCLLSCHQNNNKLPFFLHESLVFYEQASSRTSCLKPSVKALFLLTLFPRADFNSQKKQSALVLPACTDFYEQACIVLLDGLA